MPDGFSVLDYGAPQWQEHHARESALAFVEERAEQSSQSAKQGNQRAKQTPLGRNLYAVLAEGGGGYGFEIGMLFVHFVPKC